MRHRQPDKFVNFGASQGILAIIRTNSQNDNSDSQLESSHIVDIFDLNITFPVKSYGLFPVSKISSVIFFFAIPYILSVIRHAKFHFPVTPSCGGRFTSLLQLKSK